jgi:branched-chain amino acid transport system permease protein
MGQAYIGRAFMNVIIAGPGVLTGTTAASGLLGTVEYTASYVSTPFIGQAALLIFAIVLIRFLPTGLSGRWGKQL